MSSPQHFVQKREETFTAFVANLKTYKFTDYLPKTDKKKHIIIGKISAGKSSLLNTQLGLKLKVGKG